MKDIMKIIEDFRVNRGWDKTDTPNILAKSIMVEAGELLENFIWQEEPKSLQNTKEELADVLIYALTLCKLLNLEPAQIIEEKLEINKIKYPDPIK